MLNEKQVEWLQKKRVQLLELYHPGMTDTEWEQMVALADEILSNSKNHPQVKEVMMETLAYLEKTDKILGEYYYKENLLSQETSSRQEEQSELEIA